jgi:uncharacterized protein YdaU (DUF1376 family)
VNYYPHHIGDFNNATRHLTRVERALYRELIELYYDIERPLPADDFGWICKKVLASSQDEMDSVKAILREFFKLDGDGYRHSRCDLEIASYRAKQEAAVKAGKASAKSRSNRSLTGVQRPSNKRSTRVQPTKNQEPRTKNQEIKTESEVFVLPDWVPQEAWKAWLEVRKKKDSPNTPRALKLALGELERLKSQGFDPVAVLDQSTLKGWKSLWPVKPELAAATAEPKAAICDYCSKPSSGAVNGRRACDGHWQLAMDNVAPLKAPKPMLVEPKPVAGVA